MAVFRKEGKVAVTKSQHQTLSGLNSRLAGPSTMLFKPRYYRAKNPLIDMSKDPFGIKRCNNISVEALNRVLLMPSFIEDYWL